MPIFDNCVPLEAALAVVDAERHPLTHEMVQKSVGSQSWHWKPSPTSESRRSKWIDGYRRFGDQFERVFEQYHVTVHRPADITDALEQHLFDPWMVVGLLEPELPASVIRINKALLRSYDRVAAGVALMHLADVAWPERLDKLVDWLPEERDIRFALNDREYEDDWEKWFRFTLSDATSVGWTTAQALRIVDDIPYPEAWRLYEFPVLRDPENMLMHYRDGIPLELLS